MYRSIYFYSKTLIAKSALQRLGHANDAAHRATQVNSHGFIYVGRVVFQNGSRTAALALDVCTDIPSQRQVDAFSRMFAGDDERARVAVPICLGPDCRAQVHGDKAPHVLEGAAELEADLGEV
jgi:hypothetical protein